MRDEENPEDGRCDLCDARCGNAHMSNPDVCASCLGLPAEIERLRSRVAALEAECEAAWEWRCSRTESSWIKWYKARQRPFLTPKEGHPGRLESLAQAASLPPDQKPCATCGGSGRVFRCHGEPPHAERMELTYCPDCRGGR